MRAREKRVAVKGHRPLQERVIGRADVYDRRRLWNLFERGLLIRIGNRSENMSDLEKQRERKKKKKKELLYKNVPQRFKQISEYNLAGFEKDLA
ncbi:hypothetical protein PUN28_015167 [Cardiocondyla obscurior]|uniref:Uncharacterized protein n=1 Tax=Cardiocondyla obscurior TaxID=286306 RepID=A0AAW2F3E1_9HYME